MNQFARHTDPLTSHVGVPKEEIRGAHCSLILQILRATYPQGLTQHEIRAAILQLRTSWDAESVHKRLPEMELRNEVCRTEATRASVDTGRQQAVWFYVPRSQFPPSTRKVKS